MNILSLLGRWRRWGIWLAFVFYLVADMWGFSRLLAAVNRPFGGFIWLSDAVQGFSVSWEIGPDWPGRQAGLVLEDHILRIQGQVPPLDGKADVIGEIYRQAEIGQLIDYEIEREGREGALHIQIPVTLFTWRYLLQSYGLFFAVNLVLWSLGLFVHWISSKESAGDVFALLCLAFSVTLAAHNYNGFVNSFHRQHWLVHIIYSPAWPMLNALCIHFFSVTPKPWEGWRHIRLWVYGLAIALGVVHGFSFSPWGDSRLTNPTLILTVIFSIIACVYGLVALTRSYMHSSAPWMRQQAKIMGLGLGLGVLIPFLSGSVYILFRPYPDVWWSPVRLLGRLVSDWWLPLPLYMIIIATIFPFLTAWAILRYKVFDAKPAMVKTVTAIVLTGLLLATYMLAMSAWQALFEATGVDALVVQLAGEHVNWMAVSNILAILVMVMLFAPLQGSIHRQVTRLFYPYRVTVDEALKQLIGTIGQAGDTLDADAGLSHILTTTLRDILYLDDVFLWFYFPSTGEPDAGELQLVGHGDVESARLPLCKSDYHRLVQSRLPIVLSTAELQSLSHALQRLNIEMCLPLVYEGHELVGLVGLGPRRDGVPFNPEDQQVFSYLTAYLLLLLKNERAVSALRQSRERISLVQEMERRRIAQELHDETLQSLSYLATVKLEWCKRALPDSQKAGQLIQETQKELSQATAYLRNRLADISPDVISRRGLVSAVESLIGQARSRWREQNIEITLHVAGCADRMLPEQYELGVFRCVQEALYNALRHSRASRINISLECVAGHLVATVRDDGVGFEVDHLRDALRHVRLGFQNMQDRIDSLGGELVVESSPGKGCTIRAQVPLPVVGQEAD